LPVFIGESVSEFLLESAQCKLADDIITETGFSPVAGAMVQAEKAFTTGADGLVEVEHTALPLLVSSGNDAVLVNEELFTGNSRHSLIFNLFPNPVESTLFINFVGTGSQQGMKNTVKLYDINGRLLLEKLVSLENNNLNL